MSVAAPFHRVTVGLVDDHHLVREGLRLLLSEQGDVEVVGEAGTREEALTLVRDHLPDIVILDITLGDSDGIPLIPALRAVAPETAVLVLSMHRDPETVRQALMGGAAGYLIKGAFASELVASVRAVARGDRYLHSSVTDAVISDSVHWVRTGSDLTAREREVLSLYAAGLSARAIGRSLGISTNTVQRHLANLGAKLQLKGRPALTHYATEHGIVRGGAALPAGG